MDDLDATDPSSDFLSLADRSPECLETITILLRCIVSDWEHYKPGTVGDSFLPCDVDKRSLGGVLLAEGPDSFIHVSGAFAGIMSGRLGSTSPECLPMTSRMSGPTRVPPISTPRARVPEKSQKPQGFL